VAEQRVQRRDSARCCLQAGCVVVAAAAAVSIRTSVALGRAASSAAAAAATTAISTCTLSAVAAAQWCRVCGLALQLVAFSGVFLSDSVAVVTAGMCCGGATLSASLWL
jgi:hypothetical protein